MCPVNAQEVEKIQISLAGISRYSFYEYQSRVLEQKDIDSQR